MFCRIYLFFGNSSVEAILTTLSKIIDAELVDFRYVEKNGYNLEIRKNKEYNSEQAKGFPDGFLFFPYSIELEIDDSISLSYIVKDVDNVLKYLWESGYAAIASCSFENRLLKNGGYKSKEIPWI